VPPDPRGTAPHGWFAGRRTHEQGGARPHPGRDCAGAGILPPRRPSATRAGPTSPSPPQHRVMTDTPGPHGGQSDPPRGACHSSQTLGLPRRPPRQRGAKGTSGRQGQRLVVVNHLDEVRVRLLILCQVCEVQSYGAFHHTRGQVPQERRNPGGGIPYPRHLRRALGSLDGRRRGGLRPKKRLAEVGHDAGHPRGKPVGHLQRRRPRRRRASVVPPCGYGDLGAFIASSTHRYTRRLPHAAIGAGVLVVEVRVSLPEVRGGSARALSRNNEQDVVRRRPVHHVGQA